MNIIELIKYLLIDLFIRNADYYVDGFDEYNNPTTTYFIEFTISFYFKEYIYGIGLHCTLK